VHLLGNMYFLWLFGNAVNARLGHWQYLALYFLTGIVANLAMLWFGPHEPSLGASGAIMGIMGAFLILYPRNEVRSLFVFFLFFRRVDISAYWMLIAYFAMDVLGVIQGGGVIAHLAHVTGFLSGALAVGFLTWKGILAPHRNEENLLKLLGVMPIDLT
jgi:membrane associated rhomboid family serine protease